MNYKESLLGIFLHLLVYCIETNQIFLRNLQWQIASSRSEIFEIFTLYIIIMIKKYKKSVCFRVN